MLTLKKTGHILKFCSLLFPINSSSEVLRPSSIVVAKRFREMTNEFQLKALPLKVAFDGTLDPPPSLLTV